MDLLPPSVRPCRVRPRYRRRRLRRHRWCRSWLSPRVPIEHHAYNAYARICLHTCNPKDAAAKLGKASKSTLNRWISRILLSPFRRKNGLLNPSRIDTPFTQSDLGVGGKSNRLSHGASDRIADLIYWICGIFALAMRSL